MVLKKSFDLTGITHTEVMVKINFYFIDSWDSGEGGWFGLSTVKLFLPIS